jgi:hypothetical protein
MPGFRAMPAVMMTRSDPAVSSYPLVPTTRESNPRSAPSATVQPLALWHAFDDVDEDDAAGQLLLGNALGGRRSDIPGADDRYCVDHELRE